MSGWRGWASGRRPWLPAVAWVLALVVVCVRWWGVMTGPWSPYDDLYGPSLRGFAPFLGGAVALYGVLPRADWIDLQAVVSPQGRDTVAAAAVVVTFAAIPSLVRWLFTVSDFHTWFAPENVQLNSARAFALTGLEVAAVLGATCGMVGLVGRRFGPIAGLVCYAGLITIQGYRLAPALIPRLGDPHSPWSYLGALLTVVLGLTAFRLSRSGTRPVIR
ncbi:MAG: hypothetical protein QM804_01420 [Propionicimonas sp.]